jgi:hypothetical protein
MGYIKKVSVLLCALCVFVVNTNAPRSADRRLSQEAMFRAARGVCIHHRDTEGTEGDGGDDA